MTDKELKKLSRLELLELLLTESRENERLRAELEKIKQENTIKKSAQQLNETSENLDVTSGKLGEALQQVSLIVSNLNKIGKIAVENKTDSFPDEVEAVEETEIVDDIETDVIIAEDEEESFLDEIDEVDYVDEIDEEQIVPELNIVEKKDENIVTGQQKRNEISKQLDAALQLISSRIEELDRLANFVDADNENSSLFDEN